MCVCVNTYTNMYIYKLQYTIFNRGIKYVYTFIHIYKHICFLQLYI